MFKQTLKQLITLSVCTLAVSFPAMAGIDINLDPEAERIYTAPTSKGEENADSIVPNGFGVDDAMDEWIAAYEFQPMFWGSTCGLIYAGNYYYRSAGCSRYTAPIDLPQGAYLVGYRIFYRDNSTSNVSSSIQKYKEDITGTNSPESLAFGSFTSSGAQAGSQNHWVFVGETIDWREGPGNTIAGDAADLYTMVIDWVGGDSEIQAKGVRLWWRLQVAPAPATATFTDVSTSHQFFQYIEALVDSGITSGCGGGAYCPDDPVTRGQMAVFLSRALGLHWPAY